MTASFDPRKLLLMVLAVASIALLVGPPRVGPQPFYDDGRGCSMMHQE